MAMGGLHVEEHKAGWTVIHSSTYFAEVDGLHRVKLPHRFCAPGAQPPALFCFLKGSWNGWLAGSAPPT